MGAALAPVTCACEQCKAMCAESTCLPTPDEARELVRMGYGSRLATYDFGAAIGRTDIRFVGPAPKGHEGARDLRSPKGRCTFFTEDGRCEIHRHKPLEGRLAHHTRNWQPIRVGMAAHWRGKRFDSVLAQLDRATHESR
jgi:hypothetical protein